MKIEVIRLAEENTEVERVIVAFVVPGIKGESKSTFSLSQADSLQKLGVQVELIFLESRTNPLKVLTSVLHIISRVHSSRCRLIHAHFGTVTAFVCAIVSIICGIPLVITFHGSDLNNTSQADGVVRDLFQRVLSNLAALRAGAIICVSERVKSGRWWRRGRARVIACGIDLSLFQPMDRARCRQRVGGSADDQLIVFNHGTGSALKRRDIAEQAVSILRRSRPRARLVVLDNLAPSEIPVFLNAADCLLVCSDSEGSPTIVKEAMACNLPIVAVDVGDVRERLNGCAPSAIVPQEPGELAEGLLCMLDSGARSNGRTLIEGSLDATTTARQVLACYTEALGD
jgi:glycosyltransferase involved in cell wall biosynthesis